MTALEIKDMKAQLADANKKIFDLVSAEKRKMTNDEKAIVTGNQERMEELNLELRSLNLTDEPGGTVVGRVPQYAKPKERFSLMKAIRSKVEQKPFDDVARDVFTVGKMQFREAGQTAQGDIVIPCFEKRATGDSIVVGVATDGQEIVAEDKKSIMPPLVDKLVFSQAGATYLTGLVGNVSIPSYSGATVGWKAEIAAADQSKPAFAEVNFSPKRLTGYILVSKTFLAQDSVGAERLLLDNISNAVARKLESTILGVAAGSATQPQGMGYKITTGTDTKAASVVPTHTLLVGLETSVDTANALAGNLAYLTNSAGRGILKTKQKVADITGEMLCEDNMVNGYPLLVTNSASTSAGTDNGELLIFGNWADLCIAQWGGYDITVDPYTVAATNQVKIVVNAYFDAKGLRGTAPTDVHGAETTDEDDYAISFASLAIKA